jgi:hypothetical protein
VADEASRPTPWFTKQQLDESDLFDLEAVLDEIAQELAWHENDSGGSRHQKSLGVETIQQPTACACDERGA